MGGKIRHLIAKALKELKARGWKSEAKYVNTEQPRGTRANQIPDPWNQRKPMRAMELILNKVKNKILDLTT